MDRSNAIANRLAARYPLLEVLSTDEPDARALIEEAARRAGIKIEAPRFGTRPPLDAATEAIDRLLQTKERTALVLGGGHRLMGEPIFLQVLRERLVEVERGGHAIVLISAFRRPAAEIDRDRVVLELGLPSEHELRDLVEAALTPDDGGFAHPQLVALALQAARGMTRGQLRRALRRLRLSGTLPDETAIAALHAEKRDLVATSGVLEVAGTAPMMEEIGGMESLKGWLDRRRGALSEQAREFGLPAPRGVLLVGVQGCGKSLFAKASAHALGLPLLRFDLGRLFTHDSAPDENLRHALAVAEAMAPVVLWVDEIDKAFADALGSETTSRIFGTFLTWLAEHPEGIFVAATANRVDHLPAELVRKGRFDEIFFVDLPDAAVRAEVFGIHLQRSGRSAEDYDCEHLARLGDRLTGAEIEAAIADALAVAFADQRELETADIERALSEIVPFVDTYEAQVKALREWARKRARTAGRDRSMREIFEEAQRGGSEAWRDR
ncbi:MAG: AAA family ATPase [Deltaproteobacteria bacterium]|nr:AAA family ATPase [Deltaproteobacteria bacterium]